MAQALDDLIDYIDGEDGASDIVMATPTKLPVAKPASSVKAANVKVVSKAAPPTTTTRAEVELVESTGDIHLMRECEGHRSAARQAQCAMPHAGIVYIIGIAQQQPVINRSCKRSVRNVSGLVSKLCV